MQSTVETIDPGMARQYLARNTKNRPVSSSSVRMYAAAMKRGEWQTTHQGIAFDTNGNLVDGQHRLRAIIEADVPVRMLVSRGLDAATFAVLDAGKKRSAGDALAIAGEANPTLLAAMAKSIHNFEHRRTGKGAHAALTTPQVQAILQGEPGIRLYVARARSLGKSLGIAPATAGCLAFVTERANPMADLDEWYEGLENGIGLFNGDPRLALREALRPERVTKRRSDAVGYQMALYIKAFNAWQKRGKVAMLKFGATEEFPAIHSSKK